VRFGSFLLTFTTRNASSTFCLFSVVIGRIANSVMCVCCVLCHVIYSHRVISNFPNTPRNVSSPIAIPPSVIAENTAAKAPKTVGERLDRTVRQGKVATARAVADAKVCPAEYDGRHFVFCCVLHEPNPFCKHVSVFSVPNNTWQIGFNSPKERGRCNPRIEVKDSTRL